MAELAPLCLRHHIAEAEWVGFEGFFPRKIAFFPHVFDSALPSLPGPGLGLEPPGGFPPPAHPMGDAAARAAPMAPPVGPPPPAPGLPQHVPCGGFGQLGLGALGAEPWRWDGCPNRQTTKETLGKIGI